ncbi:MAG: HlyD family efflux transporter periplasmic adaptor subunit [Candidatus Latescibacterota bacterium]
MSAFAQPSTPPFTSVDGHYQTGGLCARFLRALLLAVGLSLVIAASASWVLRMEVGVSGRGLVAPALRGHAKARTAGLVHSVLVRHGQQVEAGSVVARLHDEAWRTQASQLEGDLEANAARQAGVRAQMERRRAAALAQVEDARLAVEQVCLRLEALRLEHGQPVGEVLSRLGWRRLPFAELIPVREQQTLLRQRQAALERAEEEVRAADEGLVELRTLHSERGKLEEARRQVRHRLEQAAVLAPMRGTVLTAHPEERVGDHVSDGEAVVELAGLDSWVAEVSLAEFDVHRVQPGQRARLYIGAFPHVEYRVFRGEVDEVSLVPAPTASGYPVRLRIADPEVCDGDRACRLACGMTAEARIVVDRQRIAVLVWRRLLRALGGVGRHGVGVGKEAT